MSKYAAYEVSSGRGLWLYIGRSPELQPLDAGVELAPFEGEEPREWRRVDGEWVMRPSPPDLPESVPVGVELAVGGFPPGAAVRVEAAASNTFAAEAEIGPDGFLRLTFGDSGAWAVRVAEAWPVLSRIYHIASIAA